MEWKTIGTIPTTRDTAVQYDGSDQMREELLTISRFFNLTDGKVVYVVSEHYNVPLNTSDWIIHEEDMITNEEYYDILTDHEFRLHYALT